MFKKTSVVRGSVEMFVQLPVEENYVAVEAIDGMDRVKFPLVLG